ncbi:MAG: adenylate/guanylate cyclase domain-containing protein [Mesorhizobium sp.]
MISIIAEFASVVEAVRCAVEIQEAIGTQNADLSEERQMHFRIGINLGDVIQDGDDIYGEGVNAASRLESLAEPGGIMVSETVYALTHKQLSFTFDFAAPRQVKGHEAPISGYRVRVPGSGLTTVEFQESTPLLQQDKRPALVGRYLALPRTVRVSLAMIAVFFTINLATGIRDPWFIYPAMPFAALIVFRALHGPK